ncbi:Protein kinase essential for the initiation of DNA replication [Trachipleistophora hominis]|uniref:Protein kinase essential for the initiation of DNA replication n=1 Tax=Trachipleistophora hominis TaxID=72359 RepID=L7JUY3_TRAHO|nr:Protein kinase essential for the initiation of DNA replication [Trachipleistophora hominis]
MLKKYVIFSKPYILIEDIKGKHQPFYKEYDDDKVPCIDLRSPALCCPFLKNKRFKSTKRRKERKGGFCEICYQKYVSYDAHVRERSHREFALDSRNYKDIDDIIDSFAISNFDPDLYCPVSPLLRKSASLPIDLDEKGELMDWEAGKMLDTIVFTDMGGSDDEKDKLCKAVYKVENFINEYLNE